MERSFVLLVLLANLLVLKCQEEFIADNTEPPTSTGNPNYSFSYGVSDVNTGDMKSVWETKEGDTVKGHYSVLEPDGSMRTVEYSANPKTGFTAVVNNDGEKIQTERVGRSAAEEKSVRDYGKYFDLSEDPDFEDYLNEKKRSKHPFDTVFKDYSSRKRPQHPSDLESSDFSHSITIKHPSDQASAESASHSHFGLEFDPHCKKKHKKQGQKNLYTNVVEFEANRPHDIKYPIFPSESFRENFENYESSNLDYDKEISPFGTRNKMPKLEDFNPSSLKYKYPFSPDIPTPEFSLDDTPLRPRKKYRPNKINYPNEDLDDYLWVPKKKRKLPPRFAEPNDYLPEFDDFATDRPSYPPNFDDDDRPVRNPPRGTGPKKEVIRKIVKKRKPGFNLLDILDI